MFNMPVNISSSEDRITSAVSAWLVKVKHAVYSGIFFLKVSYKKGCLNVLVGEKNAFRTQTNCQMELVRKGHC